MMMHDVCAFHIVFYFDVVQCMLYLMLYFIFDGVYYIPEDNTSKVHCDVGAGFEPGLITPLHVQQLQGSSRDATDHRESANKGKDEEIISPQ